MALPTEGEVIGGYKRSITECEQILFVLLLIKCVKLSWGVASSKKMLSPWFWIAQNKSFEMVAT